MTREEIIQGLQFTIDMFLLNPTTGETYTEPINDMDKTTIDACKGAIKLLKEESEKDEVILTKKEYGELVSSEFDNGYAKGFREALEQEPCEDVISRVDVLKVINKMDIPEDMSSFEIKSHIGVEIGTLPPVTSTQKKGKWEQYGDFWKEKYRCSECKEKQPKILCGEQIIGHWSDFCPNCGADMRGDEE